jgi:hypothetical protein
VSHASFVVLWCGTGSLCRCYARSPPFAFQAPSIPLPDSELAARWNGVVTQRLPLTGPGVRMQVG